MRGRKKEPEGKRVTISAKVSEAEAAQIDALRGDMPRSEWLRRSALATVRRVRDAVASMEPEEHTRDAAEMAVQDDCPHPKARVLKGLCRACGTYVGT